MGLATGGCKEPSEPSSYQEQVVEAQKETDPEVRVRQLARIGYRQGKAKDLAGAEETFEIAWKDSQSIAEPEIRVAELALVAEAQAALDLRAAARRSVGSAIAAVADVKKAETKAVLLARLGRIQGEVGSAGDGAATLKSAEALLPGIEDPQGRTLVYCAFAGAYDALDAADKRDRTFADALAFIKTIPDLKKQCLSLSDVAAKQADLEQNESAVKTFDLALESAAKIDSAFFRSYTMGEIGQRLSDAGFVKKARQVLQQAEKVAEKVPEQDMQFQALQKIRSLIGKLPRGDK